MRGGVAGYAEIVVAAAAGVHSHVRAVARLTGVCGAVAARKRISSSILSIIKIVARRVPIIVLLACLVTHAVIIIHLIFGVAAALYHTDVRFTR
jgi:ABC-type methionine transport system permease subunit